MPDGPSYWNTYQILDAPDSSSSNLAQARALGLTPHSPYPVFVVASNPDSQ